jgi:hypothetical protein
MIKQNLPPDPKLQKEKKMFVSVQSIDVHLVGHSETGHATKC